MTQDVCTLVAPEGKLPFKCDDHKVSAAQRALLERAATGAKSVPKPELEELRRTRETCGGVCVLLYSGFPSSDASRRLHSPLSSSLNTGPSSPSAIESRIRSSPK